MVAFQGGSIHDMSPLKWGGDYKKNLGCAPGPSLKPSLNMMRLGEEEIGESKGQHTYVWAMGS